MVSWISHAKSGLCSKQLKQTGTLMFIYYSIISQIAKGRNLIAYQWPNKVRHGQTVELHVIFERKGILADARAQMNLEDMLSI